MEEKSIEEKNLEQLTEIFGESFSLNKAQTKILTSVINYIDKENCEFCANDILPKLEKFISRSRNVVLFQGAFGLISIQLFPTGAMPTLLSAYDARQKCYAMRAIAYTTTAWAFGNIPPKSSPRIISSLQTGPDAQTALVIHEYHQIWTKFSSHTIELLAQISVFEGLAENQLKILFCSLGEGEANKLSEAILRGFECNLSHPEKMDWQQQYTIPFPS